MLRDNQKNPEYFEALIPQYLEAIESIEQELADDSITLPDEKTQAANDVFELRLMCAIACYSSGEPLEELKPHATKILEAKKLYINTANTLPPRQKTYRQQFEAISGDNQPPEIHGITRYINALWWLSLVVATGQTKAHCLEVLSCIGCRGEDALLDRIAIALSDDNKVQAENLLYPHLYRDLFKVFDTPKNECHLSIQRFLKDWYSGCWQASWYNNHAKENEQEGNWDYYFGYWSLEAVLVVNLLGLDDSEFNQHRYYPAD